ncbi:hypothetical protein [Paraburkholderia acidisoli]|uniref:hypothetical protein n=1 Tax=Paraburkholderia acidisoli TaxID=2571748 RepID=UPI0018EF1E0D|nr:hypothetical protein [Paraburkholderia acidisoli]
MAAVQRFASIVGKISSMSKHQRASIGEVNLAIRQMGDVTQRNAARVEQAAAAGSLDVQAMRLLQSGRRSTWSKPPLIERRLVAAWRRPRRRPMPRTT